MYCEGIGMDDVFHCERGYVSPNDRDIMGVTDSESIQNAVDTARRRGIGKVIIPRFNARSASYTWEIDKAILLDSDISVILDNCYMRMADDVYENFFRTNNLFGEQGPDCGHELEHIEIRGQGHAVLDGGRANDLTEETRFVDGRPHVTLNTPILFFNVRYFRVANISVINQRYWGMRFQFCKYGRISDIFFCALYDRHNQDGINLRNGCHDIMIENILAQTGDDAIALSAIDVARPGRWNLVDEGQDNDIHSVLIRNISGAAMTHPLVALRCHNGAKIYDIRIENIHDTAPIKREAVRLYPKAHPRAEDNPVSVQPVYHMDLPRYAMIRVGDSKYFAISPAVMGDLSGIRIRDITCRWSERAVVFGGEVKDVRIDSVTTGGRCRYALSTAPSGADGGPYFRAEDVTVDGITMKAESDLETAVVHTADMVPGGAVRNMYLRNVIAEGVTCAADLGGEADIVFENLHCPGLVKSLTRIREDSGGRAYVEIKT